MRFGMGFGPAWGWRRFRPEEKFEGCGQKWGRHGWHEREGHGQWHPPIEALETDGEYTIRIEIPGLKQEDVKISVTNRSLSLSGERKPNLEEQGKYRYAERQYGEFAREFRFSKEIAPDQVKARYHQGLLEITLPKS